MREKFEARTGGSLSCELKKVVVVKNKQNVFLFLFHKFELKYFQSK